MNDIIKEPLWQISVIKSAFPLCFSPSQTHMDRLLPTPSQVIPGGLEGAPGSLLCPQFNLTCPCWDGVKRTWPDLAPSSIAAPRRHPLHSRPPSHPVLIYPFQHAREVTYINRPDFYIVSPKPLLTHGAICHQPLSAGCNITVGTSFVPHRLHPSPPMQPRRHRPRDQARNGQCHV